MQNSNRFILNSQAIGHKKYFVEYVFYGNTKITGVNFPASLKEIEKKAFYNCKEATITLPTSLQTIRENAFGTNRELASLCKKVLVKTGSDFDRVKQLVIQSDYPAERIGEY